MEKKYIIAVIAVVVLWAVFMGFRHFNKKDENQAHREDTYRRMIDMAKKSPRSGLHEMADAIKRYHADNKVYPPNLGVLYPKYMPSKGFIEQVDWSYGPGEDNFSLSKSTNVNNQTMVATIDSTMKTEVQTSGGVMVAKRREPPKRPAGEAEKETPELAEAAISEDMILEVVAEREMTVKEVEVVTAAVSPELRRGDRPKITQEKVNVQTELSRIITLVGEESVSAKEAEIGYNLERYMVWKDLNGAIGVSNVEFPDRTDMYVAVKDRWYNVKRRQPEGVEEIAETQAAVVEKQKSIEEIAAGFSRDYLVWKSTGEVIGVGDTQYPDNGRLMVASQGGWSALERPAVSESETVAAGAGGGVAAGSSAQGDINAIAGDMSRQYLVWKNKDGTIGIGDAQYPDKERLMVASQGGWNALERPAVSETVAAGGGVTVGSSAPGDINTIAADMSRQYLVWKNKDGSIGIGDTQYPERERQEVASTGGWDVVTKEPLPEKNGNAAPVREGEHKPLDEKLMAAGISGQYLIWKDKNGQIGVGNVDYPEFRNIDYIHTGGSWQKIVN